MPRITSFEFEHEGSSYAIELNFDDSAMMESILKFDVIAKEKNQGLELNARVEVLPLESKIAIFVGDGEPIELNIFNSSENYLEELIDKIPQTFLLDPVFGCAIKAGVSSIVGRAVECAHSLEANSLWKNMREYFRCMSSKFSDITNKTIYRTFRCIFTGI